MSDMTETAQELVALKPPHSAEYWKMRHALVTASRNAALAREKALRTALQWYEEQARLCRLVHSGGDTGRKALNDDAGGRARRALSVKP